MIEVPGMLMIGSMAKHAGKTELVCSLIRKFGADRRITGVKVTPLDRMEDEPSGTKEGLGAGGPGKRRRRVTDESSGPPGKDTTRMLEAGADRVYWMRVFREHPDDATGCLIEKMGAGAVSICEATSLRLAVKPDLFLLVKSRGEKRCKPSALNVAKYADRIVTSSAGSFDIDPDDIGLANGRWTLRERATAIILAGGTSGRMGRDKSMLPVGGRPLIDVIYRRIEPHFKQVLVSADDAGKYSFLGVPVIPDRVAGQGPLMGIESTLAASENDLNMVIACDIPEVNMDLVKRMLREADGYDAVVPVSGSSRYEPLLAVYRKDMLGTIREVLSSGSRRVRDVFERSNVKYIEIENTGRLRNLNTMEDYEEFRRCARKEEQ